MARVSTEKTPLLVHSPSSSSSSSSSTDCCSDADDDKQCCSSITIPSSSSSDAMSCQLSDQPLKYKIIALLCVLLLAVGSHFAAHTLGAMKSIIKEEFGINNSQYGVLQSTVAIVNTILPIFFGGVIIDVYGTVPGSVCATLLITSGNILVALSTHTANWYIMVMGRVLYGVGSGCVMIVQETILIQWFSGKSLAAMISLMLTVSRLSSFLAQATVVPIANWCGWYGYGFWFSALLCVFSLVMNLIYIILLRNISVVSNVEQCKNIQVLKRKKTFNWSKLLYLPHAYWLIVLIELLLGGVWGSFLHINSEFVKYRFGYDNARASAIASVAQLLPVFLIPFLGIFVDRLGKRTLMIIGSGMTFTLAICLLNYTRIHPLIGMISFSLSLAFGPVALVTSVPALLPFSLVASGLALVKCSTNIGASLFDILTGWLQDQEPDKGYSGVMVFFILIGTLATMAGIILCILDRTIYHHVLDQQPPEKISRKQDAMADRPLKMNYFYGAILFGLMAITWALFLEFILSSSA